MLSSRAKRFHLPLCFLLCLLISWAVWVPQALTKLSDPEAPIAGSSPANLLAVWAPALSAVLLLRLMKGRVGPRMLFTRCAIGESESNGGSSSFSTPPPSGS